MKIKTAFISLLAILIFSCKPAGKLPKTPEAVLKADTLSAAATNDTKKADSLALVKDSAISATEIYDKIVNNRISFSTFTAKAKVAYHSKNEENEANAFIRIKRDSAIWISLRGPLGIEGFRVLITNDSVKVMNLLKKNVQYRSISFLEQLTGIPLDFSALQDIIIGNPVFTSNNIQYYFSDHNHTQILMTGRFFKHLASVNNDYKIVESKLDAVNNAGRTCIITYSGYNNNSGFPFSAERKISLTDTSGLSVNLNFKQYAFNQPVAFPFNISEKYKRL